MTTMRKNIIQVDQLKENLLKTNGIFKFWEQCKSIFYNPADFIKGINCPNKDIINCGAQRSGSTLLHNVIQQILFVNLASNYNFCGSEREYLKIQKQFTRYNLIKIHEYSPIIERRIVNGKSIGFFTHRDLRDVIASKIQKGWIKDIEKYISSGLLRREVNTCIAYALTKNINIFAYNDLILNKKESITKIASVLNVQLAEENIDNIISETSIKATQKKIEQATFKESWGNKVDDKTGLHDNHINDPTPGKWKNVINSEHEKMIIENASDYFDFFGYT